jgi:hypothetical protein
MPVVPDYAVDKGRKVSLRHVCAKVEPYLKNNLKTKRAGDVA